MVNLFSNILYLPTLSYEIYFGKNQKTVLLKIKTTNFVENILDKYNNNEQVKYNYCPY